MGGSQIVAGLKATKSHEQQQNGEGAGWPLCAGSRRRAPGDVMEVAGQDAPADVAQEPDLPVRAAAAHPLVPPQTVDAPLAAGAPAVAPPPRPLVLLRALLGAGPPRRGHDHVPHTSRLQGHLLSQDREAALGGDEVRRTPIDCLVMRHGRRSLVALHFPWAEEAIARPDAPVYLVASSTTCRPNSTGVPVLWRRSTRGWGSKRLTSLSCAGTGVSSSTRERAGWITCATRGTTRSTPARSRSAAEAGARQEHGASLWSGEALPHLVARLP